MPASQTPMLKTTRTEATRSLVERVRAEFVEMPGLHLTALQARKLWALDADLCDAVLSELVNTQFLKRTAGDGYIRRS
jgi:hypothetical protein